MNNKYCGNVSDFAPVSEDQSRVVIMYGLQVKEDGESAEWRQLDFYKKQGKPSLEQVKTAVIADINARITEQIVGGMTFEDKPVWLSIENQINFTTATAPCRLKIGEEQDGTPVYHDFETKAQLKAFNDACLAWKNEQLETGRAEKEGIDWTPYAEALQPVTE
jgi:hypothetical protein